MNPEQEIEATPEPQAEGAPTEAESIEAAADVLAARLVLKRGGEETDMVYPLSGTMIVGRFDPSVGPIDVDLGGIPEGSYVSRRHAKITFEDGAYTVTDLGSSNGTFLLRPGADDFARVETTVLTDGDEVAFGNARFIFRFS